MRRSTRTRCANHESHERLTGSDDPNVKRFYTLKEAVATIASKPLQWKPGHLQQQQRINTGARLVEVLSESPFTDFLQRVIYPLELKYRLFSGEELAQRLANTTRMIEDKTGAKTSSRAKI